MFVRAVSCVSVVRLLRVPLCLPRDYAKSGINKLVSTPMNRYMSATARISRLLLTATLACLSQARWGAGALESVRWGCNGETVRYGRYVHRQVHGATGAYQVVSNRVFGKVVLGHFPIRRALAAVCAVCARCVLCGQLELGGVYACGACKCCNNRRRASDLDSGRH